MGERGRTRVIWVGTHHPEPDCGQFSWRKGVSIRKKGENERKNGTIAGNHALHTFVGALSSFHCLVYHLLMVGVDHITLVLVCVCSLIVSINLVSKK